jgi:hypothetical protein
MLPRPFDGDPERSFWLQHDERVALHARAVDRFSDAHGRGRATRVGLLGAAPATALALAHAGLEVHVREPDLQRRAAFSLVARNPGPGSIDARADGLPDGLQAALAPGCILSHMPSDDALHEHLLAVERALLPGAVYIVEVWHPRLADPDSGPMQPVEVLPQGQLEGGRARYRLDYDKSPPPHMKLSVHVERSDGLPLGASFGDVRLLTLPEWRAVFQRVPRLEEAALKGSLNGERFSPSRGDRCVFVLARAR